VGTRLTSAKARKIDFIAASRSLIKEVAERWRAILSQARAKE